MIVSEEKKLIKQGYLRIKEKIKNVRQDYRNAVVQCRRSGSGKFVHDYWDLLKELWGGSPTTNCIKNARTSLDNAHPMEKESGSSQEPLEEVKYAEDGEILNNATNDLEGVGETEVNDTSASTSTSDDFLHKPKAPTARSVDNKRKILEKKLSANQRDQVFLNFAKDEVQLKQKLIDGLTEATKESNKALESISQPMVTVGKSIRDGLALLATTLSGVQTQQAPQGHAEYSPGPHNYPAFQFSN